MPTLVGKIRRTSAEDVYDHNFRCEGGGGGGRGVGWVGSIKESLPKQLKMGWGWVMAEIVLREGGGRGGGVVDENLLIVHESVVNASLERLRF